MTRTRRAATIAAFAYCQYALAIVTGIFLVPLTLHTLGARAWGLWLASSEVLSYAGMADLGILGVLPWMLAAADGRRDRAELRTLVSQGLWLGSCVGVAYAVVAVTAWHVLSPRLFLTEADRALVARPLTILVVSTALSYPIAIYKAVIVGLQDAFFNGVLAIVHGAIAVVLTAGLLLGGYGLYALVWAAVVPSVLGLVVSAVRVAMIAPDLAFAVSRPRFDELRVLFVNGFGTWLGTLGWQLLAASNGIVITYMGHPEWVPIYSCTGKVAAMCLPLAWVLPDSGHIGLAQLSGERQSDARVRKVVLMMQRLHLLVAGVMACGLLVFNPAFVTRWVGAPLFGGVPLNALLAVGVLLHSFVHGLVSSASIIGNRAKVGVLVLVNGVLQTLLAIVLGHRLGLIGIAWASLVATSITALPGGIVLLRHSASLTARSLISEAVLPWAVRALPLLALAGVIGVFYQAIGLWLSAIAAALVCLAYAWQMRPLYAAALPLNARWTDWLVRLKILPPPLTPSPIPAAAGPALDVPPIL
jgi:O-antigen/teichoic acid export membrane protein